MPNQQYQYIDPWQLYRAVAEDLDAFRSLSQTYLEIAPPMLERLEHALLAADSAAAIHESHALKGSTSLVGAVRLTQLLKEVEMLSRYGEVRNAIRLLPEIKHLLAAGLQEVRTSITRFTAAVDQAEPPEPKQ